jgi:hypothetical protein
MAGTRTFLVSMLVFLALSSTHCQISIPKKPLGYIYGGGKPTAPIHLEIYADVTCPDCQQAWPIVKQVAELYGPEKLRLIFQTFPLPFHTNAFIAAQVFTSEQLFLIFLAVKL